MSRKTVVILADGEFPGSISTRQLLAEAGTVICCDGAADSLYAYGREPDFIVGDLDSVSDTIKARFPERLVHVEEQETCDLAKCFRFASERSLQVDYLLGASGKREDHLLGNLAQFAFFAEKFPGMLLVTDHGFFTAIKGKGEIKNVPPGIQLSFFSFDPSSKITATGVKYPLVKRNLNWWYEATLNTAISDSVSVESDGPMPVLIYFAGQPF